MQRHRYPMMKSPSPRTRAAWLCTLLVIPTAVSCSDTDVQDTPGTDTTEAVTETASVTDDRPALGLDDRDFGGAVYRISTSNSGGSLVPTDMVGEAVNDLIYERNQNLCDSYNFTFEIIQSASIDDQIKEVQQNILAGDDSYELIEGHVVYSCNSAVDGQYLNLYDVPNLDFSKPWYPAQSVEQMTVYDKMYTICSAITTGQLTSGKVLVFNKDILAANNMQEPYQWVYDGTWTLDRLLAETKGLYSDANGDGARDENDMYGFASIPSQNGWLVASDTQVLSKTDDGGYEITVMSDRMQTLVEKLYSWYYESGDVQLVQDNSDVVTAFTSGRIAYAYSMMYMMSSYRNSDIRYGVVPMPKFDENQESYKVFACPSVFSIPISCQNIDFAGYVFEAMSYYGYYDVAPAYLEKTLKGKVADAPDDAAMLQIINDNLTISFAYCYDNWQGFAHFLGTVMKFDTTHGSKNLQSAVKSGQKRAQKRLESVLAAFED